MSDATLRFSKSNLSLHERNICWRFREVRLKDRWSAHVFGEFLGITGDRVRSYEYACAPIRYELARKIGEEFDINLEWFATGVGELEGYHPLPAELEKRIPKRALLSEAYTDVISHFLNDEFEKLDALANTTEPPAEIDSASKAIRKAFLADHLTKPLREAVHVLPAGLLNPFYRDLNGFVADFIALHGVTLPSTKETP